MDSPPAEGVSARHASDLALARQALAGDWSALDELERRLACLPAMVRYQARSLGAQLDAHDVEEIVRDTTLALWSKLSRFEGRSTLETWAFRFAMLQVLKWLQTQARHPRGLEMPEQFADPRLDDEGGLQLPVVDPEVLREGLRGLSEGAAEVIRLRHWEELPFETIAQRLALPLSTIKARYYRGLTRLKEHLERRQGGRRA